MVAAAVPFVFTRTLKSRPIQRFAHLTDLVFSIVPVERPLVERVSHHPVHNASPMVIVILVIRGPHCM